MYLHGQMKSARYESSPTAFSVEDLAELHAGDA